MLRTTMRTLCKIHTTVRTTSRISPAQVKKLDLNPWEIPEWTIMGSQHRSLSREEL